MALIKCRDCKAEVSDSAVRCPTCGREFHDPSTLGVIAKGLFLALNLVMALWLLIELAVGRPSRVFEPWAVGAVILGMCALVTRGTSPRARTSQGKPNSRGMSSRRADPAQKTTAAPGDTERPGVGDDAPVVAPPNDSSPESAPRKEVWRRYETEVPTLERRRWKTTGNRLTKNSRQRSDRRTSPHLTNAGYSAPTKRMMSGRTRPTPTATWPSVRFVRCSTRRTKPTDQAPTLTATPKASVSSPIAENAPHRY